MCIGGGSVAPPPPKTLAQIQAETNNEFVNPGSKEARPQWKLAVASAEKPKEKTDKKTEETKPRSELYG